MADPINIPYPMNVQGLLSASSMAIPSGTVVDDDVNAAANIAQSKLEHLHVCSHTQPDGTAVTTQEVQVHIVRAAAGATVLQVYASIATPPSGDYTIVIDVEKGNAGSAFASILSSTLTINSSTAARTPTALTINSGAMSQNDILNIKVTAAGSSGSQGQGLRVEPRVKEAAA